MDQQWFYRHGIEKHGPFSALKLRELASAGTILRTDTVWKNGVEQGAPASRVKHLFAVPAEPSFIVPASKIEMLSASVLETKSSEANEDPLTPTKQVANPASGVASISDVQIAPASQPAPNKLPVRKSRALAIRGAKLMGQDGSTVQFKKLCTTCGHQDDCRSTMKIRMGISRVNYYCPKCRRSRSVEIQGNAV